MANSALSLRYPCCPSFRRKLFLIASAAQTEGVATIYYNFGTKKQDRRFGLAISYYFL